MILWEWYFKRYNAINGSHLEMYDIKLGIERV